MQINNRQPSSSSPLWLKNSLGFYSNIVLVVATNIQVHGHDEEDFDLDEVIEAREDGQTFEESINEEIDLITEFVQGLQYQVQFHDQRMLNTLGNPSCKTMFQSEIAVNAKRH